jgi:hypothetical protein
MTLVYNELCLIGTRTNLADDRTRFQTHHADMRDVHNLKGQMLAIIGW